MSGAVDEGSAVLLLGIAFLLLTNSYAASVKEIIGEAESGSATAQLELGWIYLFGKGVARDYTRAFVWLQKAADQNLADAKNQWTNLLLPA